MTKYIIRTGVILGIILTVFLTCKRINRANLNSKYEVGQPIDSLHNVIVFYNGGVDNVVQRNTKDGYNIGLEYQCVEFVKRYYYDYLNHKMPDTYGHAVSFFDENILDGEMNKQRNLIQYSNPSSYTPEESDLMVMKGTFYNRYGHVAIVSAVIQDSIEIIQQNPGPFSPSRETFKLTQKPSGEWQVENERILGWLRKK